MDRFLKKAAFNFAESIGAVFDECKNEVKEGYVSEVDIKGDLNYAVFVSLPKETLDTVSMLLFGETDYDLKDLTNEISNLIVGNAKVVAADENIHFNISTPRFLGLQKVDFDKRIDLSLDGECFSIFYKEK